MRTIAKQTEIEIIVNKSKFITKAYPVYSKKEIKNILENLKKEYKDATHICYGYILNTEQKAFDDGEPSSTAGIPILNVLNKLELNYILVVVIRYFGGIKLGAGGLVRAYSNATTSCLKETNFLSLVDGYNITITFPYEKLSKIQYLLKDIIILTQNFDKDITYNFNIDIEKYQIVLPSLEQLTNQIIIEKKILVTN